MKDFFLSLHIYFEGRVIVNRIAIKIVSLLATRVVMKQTHCHDSNVCEKIMKDGHDLLKDNDSVFMYARCVFVNRWIIGGQRGR